MLLLSMCLLSFNKTLRAEVKANFDAFVEKFAWVRGAGFVGVFRVTTSLVGWGVPRKSLDRFG